MPGKGENFETKKARNVIQIAITSSGNYIVVELEVLYDAGIEGAWEEIIKTIQESYFIIVLSSDSYTNNTVPLSEVGERADVLARSFTGSYSDGLFEFLESITKFGGFIEQVLNSSTLKYSSFNGKEEKILQLVCEVMGLIIKEYNQSLDPKLTENLFQNIEGYVYNQDIYDTLKEGADSLANFFPDYLKDLHSNYLPEVDISNFIDCIFSDLELLKKLVVICRSGENGSMANPIRKDIDFLKTEDLKITIKNMLNAYHNSVLEIRNRANYNRKKHIDVLKAIEEHLKIKLGLDVTFRTNPFNIGSTKGCPVSFRNFKYAIPELMFKIWNILKENFS